MRDNYDFTKGIRNPYVAELNKQTNLNLDAKTEDYYKGQAEKRGIPYQNGSNQLEGATPFSPNTCKRQGGPVCKNAPDLPIMMAYREVWCLC